ncbi:MAG: NADAR family protein [Deltaproteobacteria bacterium]
MLPLDLDTLRSAVAAGAKFEYLPFYGHRPSEDGTATRACLSQWYVFPFEVDGVTYVTAEHWMMAGKARLFGDGAMLAAILAAPSPADAKKLGRRVRGFDEAAWKAARFDLVTEGNVAKFAADEALRTFLLGTGETILVEAAPRDRIWGIGMGVDNPDVHDPAKWRGANLLGFALVRARQILQGG